MKVLIIDIGGTWTDVGWAGDKEPLMHIRSCVGSDGSVGNEAFDKSIAGSITLSWPWEHGLVTNWDDYERFMMDIVKKLNVDGPNTAVVITDTPQIYKAYREKLLQVWMETFKIAKFYLIAGSMCAMYASGTHTGTVLDIGTGVLFCAPAYEGYGLPHAVRRLDLGEEEIWKFFAQKMSKRGYDFSGSEGRVAFEKIRKEGKFYIALDPATEKATPVTITLPDGSEGTMDDERWQVPEAYLQPTLIGMEAAGVDELLLESIEVSDIDMRGPLLNNIVLTGRGSDYEGFTGRIVKGITSRIPLSLGVKAIAAPGSTLDTFAGASLVGAHPGIIDGGMVTQEDCKGPGGYGIVHKKFF
mmetsp:Transcript_31778/g.61646  ORF Transcript_31778/g.61646 Transcript_31778/m.61646 type:complete len:356 (+) Transcript_31778:1-1068(+)|eukprot:CAMPEP_0183718952 /NCGR_PEP_ID=MMETSP0737-20130205/12065_1 /TAXON_ID=385413 /ORGANISM="Thalassiosira miniscula, Strain CCMP1093" /LENGTH=355 /DNA_ID=CAMNT_0025948605 /DNA_START=293 /DNA_END=1360 /DNA_ORIENTATION=-